MSLFNLHNYIGEHLNKPAIAVVSKTLVICESCKSSNGFIVKTKVEDSVHHAGHTCPCT